MDKILLSLKYPQGAKLSLDESEKTRAHQRTTLAYVSAPKSSGTEKAPI